MTHRHASLRPALALAAVAVAFALASPAAAEDWLHVRVHDGASEDRVTVDLPVSMLAAAAAFVPVSIETDARVSIDGVEWEWDELLAFWREVQAAPEGAVVTIQGRDETVKVRRDGDWLHVRASERGPHTSRVDARIPLTVVDALLSGPEGTFDFRAALTELAAYGHGNLVSFRDGDDVVEVWIDGRETAD